MRAEALFAGGRKRAALEEVRVVWLSAVAAEKETQGGRRLGGDDTVAEDAQRAGTGKIERGVGDPVGG
ncbi:MULTISPECIES: hypothetical protein [Micromonospora]|uniref:Uncharacterized protein n=1 Tax=Micromonospora sicca TaxID=2202420 RepID=A0ABU5JPK8_9ACTN|nr:hypothetical protein [Micromonospora sp. 4G53]MDZ5494254.1 hypothetical protein [Micromonospora sp. 4G53]